ncbi:ComEC/Rec2 family competence protein [Clostridioides difficile]|uniref:ComEC/Rec2 family competence protein n=1 Tax=Clostridioides difficile TaxID=1496 RepID=UPI0020B3AD94|nr:hypothetical protein [Clostridioides difficile]
MLGVLLNITDLLLIPFSHSFDIFPSKMSLIIFSPFLSLKMIWSLIPAKLLTFLINDNSFLFMGDAEEENEKEILHSFKLNNINFIKIGHHGSNSSSSLEFIKKISPDIAAISCGYKNQYGHPHREVINNLKQNHVSIYRTDRIGDIVFYSDGEIIFTKYNYEIDT